MPGDNLPNSPQEKVQISGQGNNLSTKQGIYRTMERQDEGRKDH